MLFATLLFVILLFATLLFVSGIINNGGGGGGGIDKYFSIGDTSINVGSDLESFFIRWAALGACGLFWISGVKFGIILLLISIPLFITSLRIGIIVIGEGVCIGVDIDVGIDGDIGVDVCIGGGIDGGIGVGVGVGVGGAVTWFLSFSLMS